MTDREYWADVARQSEREQAKRLATALQQPWRGWKKGKQSRVRPQKPKRAAASANSR